MIYGNTILQVLINSNMYKNIFIKIILKLKVRAQVAIT